MHAAGPKRSVSGAWMLAAFAVALAIAGVALVMRGRAVEGTVLALRLTARWSYLLFWVAYTVGAWANLIGPRLPVVAARARDFGLAFAAAHLVHVGLVAWLYRIAEHPPGIGTLEFFGVAVFFTYLLALLSFPRTAVWLTPRAVSVIRTVGVEYIALAFLVDFASHPVSLTIGFALSYGLFLALAFLGYAVRLTAFARRQVRRASA